MQSNHFGIKFVDSNFIIISKEFFEKEPLFATAVKYTDRYYINIEPNDTFSVKVFFKNKDKTLELDNFIDEFSNSLIEEQYNFDLQKRFGKIRDMIVEQAFYPLEK
ncbi:MAG: hypothetical protein LBD41_03495 [Clostridiales Family XIII bacterium]|jgi:His-Xaa-Ser system protein HxsD|nr:hypothetical protein [Clostridiales Family XIII bacterium]